MGVNLRAGRVNDVTDACCNCTSKLKRAANRCWLWLGWLKCRVVWSWLTFFGVLGWNNRVEIDENHSRGRSGFTEIESDSLIDFDERPATSVGWVG